MPPFIVIKAEQECPSLVGAYPAVIAPAPQAIRIVGVVIIGYPHQEDAPVVMVEIVHLRGAESVEPRRVTDVGSGDPGAMHLHAHMSAVTSERNLAGA
jgi:hypothetical protein